MQQSITVTIDQNTQVYYGGMSLGSGENMFQTALEQVPLSLVEKVIIRDERDPDHAKKWTFLYPYEFNSLSEKIKTSEPESYSLTSYSEQQSLRQDEKIYLDPVFLRESNVREQAPTYLPKPRPKPVVEQPVVVKEPEPVVVTEEPEEVVEEVKETEIKKEPLVKPKNSQAIDWQVKRKLGNRLSSGADDETDLFRPYQPRNVVHKLDDGLTEGQAYLPGERIETESIAQKKAKIKLNKKKSKVPFIIGGLILLSILLYVLISSGLFSSTRHYTEVCMDTRTQLVTQADACKAQNPTNAQIVYVPSADANNLEPLSNLPQSTVLTRPHGKVSIKGL